MGKADANMSSTVAVAYPQKGLIKEIEHEEKKLLAPLLGGGKHRGGKKHHKKHGGGGKMKIGKLLV